MNKKTKKLFVVAFLSGVMGQVFAQYQINKHTINNGGGITSGGTYVVKASIGQVDASNKLSSGGIYTLNGGFWHEKTDYGFDTIFKNSFE